MARLFDDSNSDYLEVASWLSAFPLTVACWFRTDENPPSSAQPFVAHGGANNNQLWFNIGTSGAVSAGVQWGPSSFSGSGSTGNTVSDTNWHHAVAQYRSGSTPYVRAILDADFANAATNTTNNPSFPSVSKLWIGGGGAGASPGSFHSGDLAELAIYPAWLTDDEIAQLFAGFAPPLVRLASLDWYLPMIRNIGAEYIGARVPTDQGATTVSDHPRVFRPAVPIIGVPAAAAGGLSIPVAMHHYRQMRAA